MTTKSVTAGIAGLLVGLLCAAACQGGIMSDPAGMNGWKNVVRFSHTSGYVVIDVQYCVYAPGQFPYWPGGVDPTGGEDYVYAYEIYNNITPKNGKDYISMLTVGLSGRDEDPANVSYVPGTQQSPTTSRFNPTTGTPTSAVWSFSSPSLGYGSISDILYYSSPYGPEMDNSTATGKYGVGVTRQVPSPTPEPATLILLSLGLAVACRKPEDRCRQNGKTAG